MDQSELQARLVTAFPPYVPSAPVAPHDCGACATVRAQLGDRMWTQVPADAVTEHEGMLPLLSPEARHALIPAWMREAIADPEGAVALMLLVHLEWTPPDERFSAPQRACVLELAEWLARHSGCDMDEIDREALDHLRDVWASVDA